VTRLEVVGVALAVIIVPLLLLALPLPPNSTWWWNHKKNVVAPVALAVALASLLTYLRPTPLFPRPRATLPLIVLGTSLLLLFATAWNTAFRRYAGSHDYNVEVFRSVMRNPWSPIYGQYDNALARPRTLPFALLAVAVAAAWYAWVRKRPLDWRWDARSLLSLLALQLALIIAFALCEPRPIGPAGYNLFRAGLAAFPSDATVGDILRDYVATMPTLDRYGQHYPPGNLTLLALERNLGMHGFAKAIVVLLMILSAVPLHRLARELQLDDVAVTATLLLYTATSGVLIFCTINTTSLLLFPATLCLWMLVRALKTGSLTAAVLLGLSFSVYVFFSFSATILGVLMALTAALGWRRGAFSARNVIRTGIVAVACVAACFGLLYLATRFSVIACFVAAVRGHEAQQGNRGFDDVERYLLRSTGNILAYALGAVPLSILALTATRGAESQADARARPLILATPLTILIAGFSGLFYLETERIWIFLTPPLALAAGVELSRRARCEGAHVVLAVFLLVLVLSCAQEFFLTHYR
jgi:hypothetical protein